jgi:hypothetical protein
MNEAADKIKRLIDIQKRKGTYDYNEHMFGVLIGLELAYYSLLGEEAKYTEKPEKWLFNKAYNDFVEGMRPMTADEAESLNEFTWNELRENEVDTSS